MEVFCSYMQLFILPIIWRLHVDWLFAHIFRRISQNGDIRKLQIWSFRVGKNYFFRLNIEGVKAL